MGNVIKIGRPHGHDKSVRLITKEEVTERDDVIREAMLAADLTSSRHQLRQVIRHVRVAHGDGVAKCLLLEVATEFWPDEEASS